MSNGLKPGSIDDLIEQDMQAFGLQHTLQRIELLCAERAKIIMLNAQDSTDKGIALKWKLFSVKLKRLSQLVGENLP